MRKTVFKQTGIVLALDVASVLAKDDYYRLDGHLDPAGHEKVSQLLAQHIRNLVK